MRFLRSLADRTNPGSLSSRFRRSRHRRLARLLAQVPAPFTILDVGGEASFWDTVEVPAGTEVVLLNKDPHPEDDRFRFVQGDARHLQDFPTASIDVLISNSVIEHVGTWRDQQMMAQEIRRVARRYYVQTPNRAFPVDPHFLTPLYHFLPREAQIRLLMRFDIGWLSRAKTRADAEMLLGLVTLLGVRELRELFPDAEIWRERFLGLTRSLIAVHGWSGQG